MGQESVITIRRAEEKDMKFVFDLRNELSVRQNSFSSDPIPWENHQAWFTRALANPKRIIYVAEVGGLPISQARFDVYDNPGEAEINIAVSERFQGKGYGKRILKNAQEIFLKEFPETGLIHAYIKPENAASRRIFEYAGYEYTDEKEHKGFPSVGMVYRIPQKDKA